MSARADERSRLDGLRRAAGSWWLRVLVTAALLAIVAAQIDWSLLQSRARHGHPGGFVLAVVLVVAALLAGAWRWRLLLEAAEAHLPVGQLLRVYAVSTFSSTFLPTSVGGAGARALLVVRRGPLLPRVITTIVVDRIGGLVGLVALAWIGVALDPSAVPGGAL